MIKGQDVVLLLKLIANPDANKWTQSKLAEHLCMSVSTINSSLKRLSASRLLFYPITMNGKRSAVVSAVVIESAYEFITCSIKYFFRQTYGEITSGIRTAHTAPIFENYLMQAEIMRVWPYAEGDTRGSALLPLYPSVPKSVSKYPDEMFYNLLCLTDALRCDLYCREKKVVNDLLKNLILGQNDNKQIV